MTFYTTLQGKPLLPWFKIEIRDAEDGNREVVFHSKIHVRDKVAVSWRYDSAFTVEQILHDQDLVKKMQDLYGNPFERYNWD